MMLSSNSHNNNNNASASSARNATAARSSTVTDENVSASNHNQITTTATATSSTAAAAAAGATVATTTTTPLKTIAKTTTTPSTHLHPPIISLHDPQIRIKIADACSAWGAFVLTDVDSLGLTEKLQNDVIQVGHTFFQLSSEVKEQYSLEKFGVKWRGYQRPTTTPITATTHSDNNGNIPGTESSSSSSSSSSKWEGLFLGVEDPPTKRQVLDQLPTFGANVLPDLELPHMRSLLDEYHSTMRDVGDHMMTILSDGLDLPLDVPSSSYLEEYVTLSDPILLPRIFRDVKVVGREVVSPGVATTTSTTTTTTMPEEQQQQQQRHANHENQHGHQNMSTTRNTANTNIAAFNGKQPQRFPPRSSNSTNDDDDSTTVPTTTEGLWSMTLSDGPGLEFQHPINKTWNAVPFVPHSIVMNVGDLLDRLSDGRYISPCYRWRSIPDHAHHPPLLQSQQQAPQQQQQHRLMLPFLYNPSWDAILRPLPHNSKKDSSITNITNNHTEEDQLDQEPSVKYSTLLSQQVAQIFPDLVSSDLWKTMTTSTTTTNATNTTSTSTNSNSRNSSSRPKDSWRPKLSEPLTIQPALVVQEAPEQASIAQRVLDHLEYFYKVEHPEIKESHGWDHIIAVYQHANRAIDACQPPLSSPMAMEILVATLLHDVDDSKYFGTPAPKEIDLDDFDIELDDDLGDEYPNAVRILQEANVPEPAWENIIFMVDIVCCSMNGNSIPSRIAKSREYYWLIPRWADRIEAVGAKGVVRCYQYNQEKGLPLSSVASPRPTSVVEMFHYYVTPARFQAYQDRGGTSSDMISHYYDKLLHVACPPPEIVQNSYLEAQLSNSAKELVEVCLRFGRTGQVDVAYIQSLAAEVV